MINEVAAVVAALASLALYLSAREASRKRPTRLIGSGDLYRATHRTREVDE